MTLRSLAIGLYSPFICTPSEWTQQGMKDYTILDVCTKQQWYATMEACNEWNNSRLSRLNAHWQLRNPHGIKELYDICWYVFLAMDIIYSASFRNWRAFHRAAGDKVCVSVISYYWNIFYKYIHVYLSTFASPHYLVFQHNLHLGKYILMLFSVSFRVPHRTTIFQYGLTTLR